MRAPGTLLLVLLAATARAGDTPVPAGDAFATAKKDLAAMKAPNAQGDAAAAIPELDLKDLGTVPGAVRPDTAILLNPEKDPALDPTKKKLGTGNWLVDAMDKNTSTQASRTKEKDDVLKGDPDLIRADEKGVRLERDPLALDDTREKDLPKEAVGPVYNPLDAFMSGWVSARDHDLLLTSSKGEGLAGGDLGKVHADPLPGLDAAAPFNPAEGVAVAGVDAAAFGGSRGANPYVESVEMPAVAAIRVFSSSDASPFGPAGFEDAPRAVSQSGVDPAPADATRSFIPDFAQPQDDDKYFKQLRKF